MIIRTVTYKRADTSIPFWQPSQSQQQHLDYINNGKMISFDSATPDQYTQIKTIKFIDIRNLWSGRFGYVSPF